jgi:hypothetical protein
MVFLPLLFASYDLFHPMVIDDTGSAFRHKKRAIGKAMVFLH